MRGILRNQGLETPLLQRRLVNAWDEVIREKYDQELAGYIIENTEQKDIRNQTLWVKIASPAIRADLQMKSSDLAATLNNKIGTQVITNIRLY
jgi:predicted nucleic acid-binding Zn ribbon protein